MQIEVKRMRAKEESERRKEQLHALAHCFCLGSVGQQHRACPKSSREKTREKSDKHGNGRKAQPREGESGPGGARVFTLFRWTRDSGRDAQMEKREEKEVRRPRDYQSMRRSISPRPSRRCWGEEKEATHPRDF